MRIFNVIFSISAPVEVTCTTYPHPQKMSYSLFSPPFLSFFFPTKKQKQQQQNSSWLIDRVAAGFARHVTGLQEELHYVRLIRPPGGQVSKPSGTTIKKFLHHCRRVSPSRASLCFFPPQIFSLCSHPSHSISIYLPPPPPPLAPLLGLQQQPPPTAPAAPDIPFAHHRKPSTSFCCPNSPPSPHHRFLTYFPPPRYLPPFDFN